MTDVEVLAGIARTSTVFTARGHSQVIKRLSAIHSRTSSACHARTSSAFHSSTPGACHSRTSMSSVIVAGAGIIGVSIADALARRGARRHRARHAIARPRRVAGVGRHPRAVHRSARRLAAARARHAQPVALRRVRRRRLRSGPDARSSTRDAARSRSRSTRRWHRVLREIASDVARPDRRRVRMDRQARLVRDRTGRHRTRRPAGCSSLTRIRRRRVAASPRSCRARGSPARVFESPVEVDRRSSRARMASIVRAGDRRYAADAVVHRRRQLVERGARRGVPPLPVRPVRGQLLQLRGADTPRSGARSCGARAATRCRGRDGTLLVGATVEDVGFDERSTVAGVHELHDAVAELLPASRQPRRSRRARRPSSGARRTVCP